MDAAPDPDVIDRIARILGWTPRVWRRATGGYTPTARYVVSDGDISAFAKIATTPVTVGMLHREIAAYGKISGPFVPRLLGADPDPDQPLLVIEDLSTATWPPPWSPASIAQVLAAIHVMHATPSTLPPGGLLQGRAAGWPSVGSDPGPFLALGYVDQHWLDRHLPALIAAESECQLSGNALTHLDLRSDNLCITPEGVKFIDWTEACRSNPDVDLGFFLPSLAFEGGPLPDAILPRNPAIAATVAGFFAARAGLPDIAGSPLVSRVQREQLSTALPWALRALDLPPGSAER
jgi:hypothetical protein